MEFYVKAPGDPNFDPTSIHSESEIAMLITQLETVLFTNKGEVLGEPGFGANLEHLIYALNYNEGTILAELERQIDLFVPLAKKYGTDVSVSFYKGTVRDIAQIDITIDSKYQVGVYIN